MYEIFSENSFYILSKILQDTSCSERVNSYLCYRRVRLSATKEKKIYLNSSFSDTTFMAFTTVSINNDTNLQVLCFLSNRQYGDRNLAKYLDPVHQSFYLNSVDVFSSKLSLFFLSTQLQK